MANRLGIFVAAVIAAFGLFISQPWRTESAAGFNPGGQMKIFIASVIVGAVLYALIRGLGWVFSGK